MLKKKLSTSRRELPRKKYIWTSDEGASIPSAAGWESQLLHNAMAKLLTQSRRLQLSPSNKMLVVCVYASFPGLYLLSCVRRRKGPPGTGLIGYVRLKRLVPVTLLWRAHPIPIPFESVSFLSMLIHTHLRLWYVLLKVLSPMARSVSHRVQRFRKSAFDASLTLC